MRATTAKRPETATAVANLIRFLETGAAPDGLFTPDAFTDLSLPHWRIQAGTAEEILTIRSGSHPFPGQVRVERVEQFVHFVDEERVVSGGAVRGAVSALSVDQGTDAGCVVCVERHSVCDACECGDAPCVRDDGGTCVWERGAAGSCDAERDVEDFSAESAAERDSYSPSESAEERDAYLQGERVEEWDAYLQGERAAGRDAYSQGERGAE